MKVFSIDVIKFVIVYEVTKERMDRISDKWKDDPCI